MIFYTYHYTGKIRNTYAYTTTYIRASSDITTTLLLRSLGKR